MPLQFTQQWIPNCTTLRGKATAQFSNAQHRSAVTIKHSNSQVPFSTSDGYPRRPADQYFAMVKSRTTTVAS
ncbi:hypothetical protein JG687_00019204, partial [Phytophthora cactorum]